MALYNTYSDEQLVVLLRNDDDEAFVEIYNRYWDKLLAIGYNHAHSKEIAEEIVQDVFMSLWNRRNNMDIDRLSAYLATAVKFAVFKVLAKENRRKALLADQLANDTAATLNEAVIEAKFLKEYLDGVVAGLPEKCRLVFTYSREHQLSTKEIAEALQLSHKTVESHLTKALKTIRHYLGSHRFFTLLWCIFNALHLFLKKS
jgi:RNA polymerase sigma-70 factor (family 1)